VWWLLCQKQTEILLRHGGARCAPLAGGLPEEFASPICEEIADHKHVAAKMEIVAQ
jgi:hypothetical protein